MVDNTDYAERKIKDFKYAYKVAMNPFENKAVDEIIDAMFENVGCYYRQFQDSIDRVPTSIETYRYHLITPNSFSMLCFTDFSGSVMYLPSVISRDKRPL